MPHPPPGASSAPPAGRARPRSAPSAPARRCRATSPPIWRPRVELWNGYGPTETTVWSSFHRVDDPDGPVLIGHPVANTTLHVLDEDLQPVPVGVVGELFIGGDGVTLGYLDRPELTAERFLPDRTRGQPGAKLYRTGDLARWRAA